MDDADKRKLWREQKQAYRKTRKEYILILTPEQSLKVEELANEKQMSVQEYIKELLKANTEGNGYVVPKDSGIKYLVLEIRKIGSNVNQIVKHINTVKAISIYDIQRLKERLTQLEHLVINSLTNPPKKQNDH
ncbi:MAG: plasmid mobilization relaxosome protein MobC [Bacteroidetes bacterium]|nr:plasmid mobilization relaxosome protein MobC [Bacteroidota bacterium]